VSAQEPELLRVDGERVRRQMQEVAVENYAAFIAASEALSFVRAQLEGFDKHLEALVMSAHLGSLQPVPFSMPLSVNFFFVALCR
jgi:hypothetical protein